MQHHKFKLAIAGLVLSAVSFAAGAQSFSNNSSIPLPDLVDTSSTVNVSGFTGQLSGNCATMRCLMLTG